MCGVQCVWRVCVCRVCVACVVCVVPSYPQLLMCWSVQHVPTCVCCYLEEASPIRCDQSVDDVVLAGGEEPLATVGKLEGKYTGVMATKAVLLRLVNVEHLHQAVLHSAGEQDGHIQQRYACTTLYFGMHVCFVVLHRLIAT